MADVTTNYGWTIPTEFSDPWYAAFLALMNQIDAQVKVVDNRTGASLQLAGTPWPAVAPYNLPLVAANAVTIVPNTPAGSITIGESHSALTTNPHGTTLDQVLIASSAITAARTITGSFALGISTGTITASTPHSLTQTWNAGGVTFTALLVNVTDTASAAASLLLDLQKAGVSQFNVSKLGAVTAASFAAGLGANVATLAGTGTGVDPTLTITGTDTNRGLVLIPKGTGLISIGANPLRLAADPVNVLDAVTLQYFNANGAAKPTVLQKTGSKSGTDYSTSSTTFVDVDATNLAYTVTIPVGWRLLVIAHGTMRNSSGGSGNNLAIYDTQPAAVIASSRSDSSTANYQQVHAVTAVITGDGNSHTIKMQFAAPSGTTSLGNSATEGVTNAPVAHMTFILTASN